MSAAVFAAMLPEAGLRKHWAMSPAPIRTTSCCAVAYLASEQAATTATAMSVASVMSLWIIAVPPRLVSPPGLLDANDGVGRQASKEVPERRLQVLGLLRLERHAHLVLGIGELRVGAA